MSAPSIKWVKYTVSSGGGTTTAVANDLSSNNTVDYDAVQAGNYSNIMCVRPQFSANEANIGKVRFWWADYNGKISGDSTQVSLPGTGWKMKYYVSHCTTQTGVGTQVSVESTQKLINVAKMLSTLSQYKTVVTTGKTFTPQSWSSETKYYKSVWQNVTDTTYISMQPIPFFKDNVFGNATKQATTFSSVHTGDYSDWKGNLFGAATSADGAQLLYYSVGGVLNTDGTGCNMVDYVIADGKGGERFPFIFLTICPPSTASAGTWSGFSCRMSFVWPYTPPSTNQTT